MYVFSAGSRKTSLVDWTLEIRIDRPRKTGSRCNDIGLLSSFGKPNGSHNDNRIGAISWKAQRRGVSSFSCTDFDTDDLM